VIKFIEGPQGKGPPGKPKRRWKYNDTWWKLCV